MSCLKGQEEQEQVGESSENIHHHNSPQTSTAELRWLHSAEKG